MSLQRTGTIITLGLAIFSMFFGAGNVIFPLALGVQAGEHFSWAFIGLILTSIGAPLLGLYGALLYKGDLRTFFDPMGKYLGTAMILVLVIALGPIGAMPRCLTLTYSALTPIFPQISFGWFSAISAVVILLSILKRSFLLPILGKFLSPLLIIMLFAITLCGIIFVEPTIYTDIQPHEAFFAGFHEGYKTMDLLAAILFSITIWRLIQDKLGSEAIKASPQMIYHNCIFSSLIAGLLLAITYVGLGFAAKSHAGLLHEIRIDEMLGALSLALLGPQWAIIANLTIALACFTTIVSLAVAAVDILWQTFQTKAIFKDKEKMFYKIGIVAITLTTAAFANIGFDNISIVISTIVNICYPAIITLTICNILHKKIGLKMHKMPTYGVLGITILSKIF